MAACAKGRARVSVAALAAANAERIRKAGNHEGRAGAPLPYGLPRKGPWALLQVLARFPTRLAALRLAHGPFRFAARLCPSREQALGPVHAVDARPAGGLSARPPQRLSSGIRRAPRGSARTPWKSSDATS
ncbi:MAG: hypothetical protein BroJett026_34180 [Betaproteobacteria bacterium]|nr:MAG: hypothetical protein BroJett026_34180 [Betaproteobacteria bacterium]